MEDCPNSNFNEKQSESELEKKYNYILYTSISDMKKIRITKLVYLLIIKALNFLN